MLTAREIDHGHRAAATPATDAISNFAHAVSGIVSVGLNAVAFVNEV